VSLVAAAGRTGGSKDAGHNEEISVMKPFARSRARRLQRSAAALAAGLAASAGTLALSPAVAHAATPGHRAAVSYTFKTLDNAADPTFNQLLGINVHHVICGYFGSGNSGHPNKGYLLNPPYGQSNYVSENFPGSAQTQVTGLNNFGDTAGFWVNGKGTNRGFVAWNGVFTSYTDPHTPNIKKAVNQLLGINNNGLAVGFYNDAKGNSHAYELNQATGVFTAIHIPGAVSTTATGINNDGAVVGFSTNGSGVTSSWLLHRGTLITYQFPHGSGTEAFGVNNHDQVVGSYLDSAKVMHGFVLSHPGPGATWQSINDPKGAAGTTVVNGIDFAGDLVGFYTDRAGNTHGMLATPAS
jgi:probable HAF family extracellular repeat protein